LFFRIYHTSHLLSLDVVLGAIAGMYFFATLFDVVPEWPVTAVLGLAVWVLYTLDHLRDTFTKGNLQLSERHLFHLKFRIPLFLAVISAVIIGFALVLQIDKKMPVLYSGIGLGLIILISWVIINKRAPWLKEFSTAIFYVSGLLIGPFWMSDLRDFSPVFLFFILGYILLAWINLLILAFLDAELDQKAEFNSILTVISRERLNKWILWIGFAAFCVMLIMFVGLPSYFRLHTAVLMIMLTFHLIQYLQKEKLNSPLIRKRLEAVFLFPYILLLL
jgi:hypothetical protein